MTNQQRDFKLLLPLTGVFVAVLLLSNVTSQKLFVIGPFVFPGGIVLFPIAYIFGDILTEVYGYARSRKVIWTGFFCQILAATVYFAVGALPPADELWQHQEAFDQILGTVPRIVAASMIGYFCGEFTNAAIMARMKVSHRGTKMRRRFVVSTIFGEFADTIVFMSIAFIGVIPLGGLLLATLSAYLFKVIYEIVMLPATSRLAVLIKKIEYVDHFDHDTNLNPFAVFRRGRHDDDVTTREVVLTHGYTLSLSDTDGLEHLFRAVVMEVLQQVRESPEFKKRGWILVYELGICELHYVAGQLKAKGSSLDIQFLLDHFAVEWDRIADRLRNE